MKTPWNYIKEKKRLESELEEKEEKIKQLEDEKESISNRFEAEKKRRSKLSTEKQKAEKQLKKLEQKLHNKPDKKEESKEAEKKASRSDVSFKQVKRGLENLANIESKENDLLTIYKGEKDFEDVKALKNSVSSDLFREISDNTDFTVFTDEGFFRWMLKSRPFFETSWSRNKEFETDKLIDFIEKEKYWLLASMGETKIFREASGEFEEVERIKTRVNRKQKKGGFSQGRFERKRDEQIRDHVKKVNEEIKKLEGKIFVIGDKRLCKNINADYLGGFDSSKPISANIFYNFELKFLI